VSAVTPHDRARLLDAEMRIERAWLELSLRDARSKARESLWYRLEPWKLAGAGMSLLKNRSVWLAAVSFLLSLYRQRTGHRKEKHHEAAAQEG
jgi:hypothetical protein